MQENGQISPEVEQRVMGQLKSYFRPEFLNRIDDIILFSPLTKNQIMEIIGLSLSGLEKRLLDRDMRLELTDNAKSFIADEAYDPHYGARPVNRYLQKNDGDSDSCYDHKRRHSRRSDHPDRFRRKRSEYSGKIT